MYCRQCGYRLFGLSANRCPECGQVFDPANRGTYLRYPPLTQGERVVMFLAAAVALAGLATGGGGLGAIVFVLVFWWQRARRRRIDEWSEREP
jgi:uncharacterized protein (TIGR03382 family)